MYIPYKKITKNQKGQGKFGKKLRFPMSSGSDMSWWTKWTPMQEELQSAARARRLTGQGCNTLWMTQTRGKHSCTTLLT